MRTFDPFPAIVIITPAPGLLVAPLASAQPAKI
jgi:hypothetical protein